MIELIRIVFQIPDCGCVGQKYVSMAKAQSGFSRRYFFCPYKKRCSCQVSFSIKEYKDRYELLQSGVHDRQSHDVSSWFLSLKQRSAIVRLVKASPLSGPTEVLLNLKNLSPGKRVAHDVLSTAAVGRLVLKARSEVMASRTPGGFLDGSEGSMIELAESLSLQRFIDLHNDPDDPYHHVKSTFSQEMTTFFQKYFWF